ncbi:unnamed protein product (macronuclear) [Paramecium tetraurelia]|uniref:AIG1-type G domain-containing protein n=1 Tax=Paramecium tetraurelia TaxID=5888 RepID=A0E186_PARTE|nr:uncharacterized protein GSPATT00022222001 [Paramecium tetraurelia]CAK89053.1 unnamed protein product [Paramecium tetraurelia]|eukprot:XP_001456450.1 hypothetical protein (macronuclear) [Paramecium tetraurelia strain d4-2]
MSILTTFIKYVVNLVFEIFLKAVGCFRKIFGTQHQLALILGINYSPTLFIKLQNTSSNFKQNNFQSHKLWNSKQNKNFYVVSCPFLTLTDTIDEREKCIEEYQKFFRREALLKSQIKCLYIVTEYDRTDIIKANLLSCIKWFHQYRDLIIIVITSFEKADDQKNSSDELYNALQIFVQADKRIILVNKNTDSDLLNEQFLNAAQQVSMKGEFHPRNTIFEGYDQQEGNRIMQQLHLSIKKYRI